MNLHQEYNEMLQDLEYIQTENFSETIQGGLYVRVSGSAIAGSGVGLSNSSAIAIGGVKTHTNAQTTSLATLLPNFTVFNYARSMAWGSASYS
jgi:hypothetical protein